MTEFGWDASDFDWSRGAMDVGAAARDGIQFFTHKATEGTSVRHVHYGQALNRARDAGIPVLGAYHVVRSVGALSVQVKEFLAYLDEATPWWRSHPNFFLQVDLERWPYDDVAATTGTAFADQLAAAAGKWVVIYASKGQYGNGIPGGRPLWNAAYPSSAAGGYASLYAAAGGDGGRGWQPYSGRTAVFWQYTDNATIGGQHGCDANAFRGSLAELLALTSGSGPANPTGDDMALTDQVQGTNSPDHAANRTVAEVLGDLYKLRLALMGQIPLGAAGFGPATPLAVGLAQAAPVAVTLTQSDRDAIIAGLAGLVPTTEELRATVDAAVKARLDGATVHTAGS